MNKEEYLENISMLRQPRGLENPPPQVQTAQGELGWQILLREQGQQDVQTLEAARKAHDEVYLAFMKERDPEYFAEFTLESVAKMRENDEKYDLVPLAKRYLEADRFRKAEEEKRKARQAARQNGIG